MIMSDKSNTLRVGSTTPCIGFASDAFPEARMQKSATSLQKGVSTNSTHSRTKDIPHWYALRTTYGREKKGSVDI